MPYASKSDAKKYARNYYKTHIEDYKRRAVASTRRKRYGITEEAYGVLVQVQKNLCAICNRPPEVGGKKSLDVDHDHSTGRVRGLLCTNCNTGIGLFKDNPALLLAAISYLKVSN